MNTNEMIGERDILLIVVVNPVMLMPQKTIQHDACVLKSDMVAQFGMNTNL